MVTTSSVCLYFVTWSVQSNIGKNFPTISWYQKTLCSCCIYPLPTSHSPYPPTLPLSLSSHPTPSHHPTPPHSPLINTELTIQFINPTRQCTHTLVCWGLYNVMSCASVLLESCRKLHTHLCSTLCCVHVVFMLSSQEHFEQVQERIEELIKQSKVCCVSED